MNKDDLMAQACRLAKESVENGWGGTAMDLNSVAEVVAARTRALGAKSMSESPDNPVAPALADAIARATGARLHQLPMNPIQVWRALNS